ncbi:MAG TPA: MBL fold metallo-hydrolase, partial [Caulobacterales bacterium]|nr:MBL fold metallo-hydrolase [Caulobacterales bacterium]
MLMAMLTALAFAALANGEGDAAPQHDVAAAPPQALAPSVALLPGEVPADRGPDGNTVIFAAPDGLIVVDTGRHVGHSDAILAYARAHNAPIAAIVNTHWHLDHTSGNRRLKAVFPHARVYATTAIDRALAPDGFLMRNLAAARQRAEDASLDPVARDETQLFLDTMAHSESLRPDIPITRG